MALEKQITEYEAYLEMRRRCSYEKDVSFPINLLMAWDEMRMRLNPNACLSYAQELILQAAAECAEIGAVESEV